MADVVEAVATRLETVLGVNRAVYRRAVPSHPAARYLLVNGSAGVADHNTLSGAVDARQPVVWVTSVSHADDAPTAAREAAWGSDQAVQALMDYRFTLGRATWLPEHVASAPLQRDDDLPDFVMYGVDQFSIQYQP